MTSSFAQAFAQKNLLIRHERGHTGEKLYSCQLCEKHYISSSALKRHNKTTKHLEMMKSCNNTVPTSVSISLIECKEVYIKEEIKEEEIFEEDPLSIQMRADNIEENIKQEIEDPLSCQQNYDEDRFDTIDIVHHKIEI